MTDHPLTVAARLAADHVIRPSTYAAVEYALRDATTPILPAACLSAAWALEEDARTAPAAAADIAAVRDELAEWAEAA